MMPSVSACVTSPLHQAQYAGKRHATRAHEWRGHLSEEEKFVFERKAATD